jgi:streptogramin lyase
MSSHSLTIALLLCPFALACSSATTGGKNKKKDTISFGNNDTFNGAVDSGVNPFPSEECAPHQKEIIGSQGPECAEPCDGDSQCPDGRVCHILTDQSGNPASFCIEPHATLCYPCHTHADCNPATSGTQNLCISSGGEGSFCGGACQANGVDCPAGYSCQEIEGVDAPITTQCVSDTNSCTCTPYAIAIGATTDCANENVFGKCLGSRSCTASGLSSCEAPIPVAEVCNELDDNCDGVVDEGVESPCGGCGTECVFEISAQEVESVGTHRSPEERESRVKEEEHANPFIWIANSAENTVSRLNTTTGCEEARYYVCSDPSRTAVSLDGAGIVGCRSDGQVYKIAVSEGYCIDKNGNGTIETVKDTNEDCVITPDEMVQDDECIVWKVSPVQNQNGCARAAGVDTDGNVWVGMWNSKQLYKLDGETGETLKTHPITMRPYGLAIDQEGIIWIASRDPNGALGMVHPENGQLNTWQNPTGECYGMAIDPYQGVWVATGWSTGGLARFDMESHTWQTYSNPGMEATRGVAIKLETDDAGLVNGATVYASHHGGGCGSNQYVTVVDAQSGQVLPSINIGSGKGPVGAAIDSDGNLWTVNQCGNSATKIDGDTHNVLGTYPVGSGPYTYSDMTGYALKTITTISGDYKHIIKGWEGGTTYWETLEIKADFPNELTSLDVSFRTGNSINDLKTKEWTGPYGPYPEQALAPLTIDQTGHYLEVKVSLHSKSYAAFPLLKGFTVKAKKL